MPLYNTSFERPIGAAADVKELEYLSALQQTERTFLRPEATLTSVDVRRYLKSRHGLDVSVEDVERHIFQELVGSTRKATTTSTAALTSTAAAAAAEFEIDEEEGATATSLLTSWLRQRPKDLQEEPKSAVTFAFDGRERDIEVVAGQDEGGRGGEEEEGALGREETETAISVTDQGPHPEPDPRDDALLSSSKGNESGDVYDEPLELDIVQMASLILLPVFCEIAQHDKKNQEKKDVEGGGVGASISSSGEGGDLVSTILYILVLQCDFEAGCELTKPVLKRLLRAYGEDRGVADEVLDAMIDQASATVGDASSPVDAEGSRQPPRLNRECLLAALTADVRDYYNTEWTERLTTVYEDAQTSDNLRSHATTHRRAALVAAAVTPSMRVKPSHAEEGGDLDDDSTYPRPLTRIYTAPNIDTVADTYMSIVWHILAWLTMATVFFSYAFHGIQPVKYFDEPPCMKNNRTMEIYIPYSNETTVVPSIVCSITSSIVSWLTVFVLFGVLGFLFMFLVTLMNSIYLTMEQGYRFLIFGIVSIAVLVAFAFMNFAFRQDDDNSRYSIINIMASYVSVVLGCLLFLVQVYCVIRLLVPERKLTGWLKLIWFQAVKFERSHKRAAAYKANQMIENALACHEDSTISAVAATENADAVNSKSSPRCSSVISSLDFLKGTGRTPSNEATVRFYRNEHKTQMTGGVSWVYQNLWSGNMAEREGIWIRSPRIISCNIIQWLVFLGFIGALIFGTSYIRRNDNINEFLKASDGE